MRRDTLNIIQDLRYAIKRYKGTFTSSKGSTGKENLSDYKWPGFDMSVKKKKEYFL